MPRFFPKVVDVVQANFGKIDLEKSQFLHELLEREPNNITLELCAELGSGAEGKAYFAFLIHKNVLGQEMARYIVVAKESFGKKSLIERSCESKLHAKITNFFKSSAEACVLKYIGEMRVDIDGEERIFSVVPWCDLVLQNIIPDLLKLKRSSMQFSAILLDISECLVKAVHSLIDRQDCKVSHDDFKPGNFGRRAKKWVAFDFGVADDHTATVVRNKSVYGCTPYYAAPELFEGESFILPGKADIYSAGVMLRELLGDPVEYGLPECQAHVQVIFYKSKEYIAQCGLYRKTKTFSELRVALEEAERARNMEYLSIIQSWKNSDKLYQNIHILADWMIAVLPEFRPSLAVLDQAIKRLNQIMIHQAKSAHVNPEKLLQTFYEKRHIAEMERLQNLLVEQNQLSRSENSSRSPSPQGFSRRVSVST